MSAPKIELPLADFVAFARNRLELLDALREMVAAYGSDDGHGPIEVIEKSKAAIVDALSARIVEGETSGAVVPLKEFLAVNGFEGDERARIVEAMIAGNTFAGGGGAAIAWRIDPVITEIKALEKNP
jgi:hypothetical protein